MSTKTKKLIGLPDDLSGMQRGGLENLHSEMLATASDVGYDPPEEFCREFGETDAALGQARDMLPKLHAALQEHLERHPDGKPLAPDGGKSDTYSGGAKSPEGKKSTKKADKASAKQEEKEKIVATAPKKAAKPAKKTAKKAKAKAAPKVHRDDAKKLSWVHKGEGNGVREGTDRHARREMLRKAAVAGKTVGEFVKGGGKRSSLSAAITEKVVRLVG